MQANFCVSILVVLSLHLYDVKSLKLQTIGIYSLCNDNHTQNEFTQYAHAMELFVRKNPMIRISMGNKKINSRYITHAYKSYDVCYDHEKLVSVLMKLLLDSKFYVVGDFARLTVCGYEAGFGWFWFRRRFRCSNHNIKVPRSSTIIRVIAHIPTDMLLTLLDVMSIEKQILITLHSPLINITERMNARGNFLNIMGQYGDVEEFLRREQWKNVLILRNRTNSHFFNRAFFKVEEILKNLDNAICFKIYTVNSEIDLKEKFEREFQSNYANYTIVIDVGTPYGKGEYSLNNNASYFKNIIELDLFYRLWHTSEERRNSYKKRQVITLRHVLRSFIYWMTDDQYFERFGNSFLLRDNMQKHKSSLKLLDYSTRYLITRIPLQENLNWTELINGLSKRFHSRYNKDKGSYAIKTNIPKNIKSDCFHPFCLKGEEEVFRKLSKGKTHWDEEFGYVCEPCKQNYIKPSTGDSKCQPCPGYFVSNKDKTKCINPLQSVHHVLTETSGAVALSICTSGAILSLSAIIIWIKHRQTPIVKISDFTTSLIHLTVMLSYFCSTPVFYFLKPTQELCMARTLSVAFFYNLNTSIVFTKSNKLLKAFSTNIRSTKFEVWKTYLIQVFIIIISVLAATWLIGALWFFQFPKVKVRIDRVKMQENLYCNNVLENIEVSGLMLFIHLACFIQAFRCRKLPGHLNEAMNIVYASFIATFSLCVMFPIYFSQKFEEDGELVVVLVLSGNSLILFLFMYARKLFIITFKPERNTKEHFRRKRMEAMEKKARKLRAKPNNKRGKKDKIELPEQ